MICIVSGQCWWRCERSTFRNGITQTDVSRKCWDLFWYHIKEPCKQTNKKCVRKKMRNMNKNQSKKRAILKERKKSFRLSPAHRKTWNNWITLFTTETVATTINALKIHLTLQQTFKKQTLAICFLLFFFAIKRKTEKESSVRTKS